MSSTILNIPNPPPTGLHDFPTLSRWLVDFYNYVIQLNPLSALLFPLTETFSDGVTSDWADVSDQIALDGFFEPLPTFIARYAQWGNINIFTFNCSSPGISEAPDFVILGALPLFSSTQAGTIIGTGVAMDNGILGPCTITVDPGSTDLTVCFGNTTNPLSWTSSGNKMASFTIIVPTSPV